MKNKLYKTRSNVGKISKKAFSFLGYEISKISNRFNDPIDFWNKDETFKDIYKMIEGKTIFDKTRCFILFELLNQSFQVDGEVAEVGVYKGGTAKLFAETLERKNATKNIYIFDTFEGMPDVDKNIDLHNDRDFKNTEYDEVVRYLAKYKNVAINKGIFPETGKSIENTKFSFVHIDVDIYKSTIDCCNFFYYRISKGGVMIFDDYGFPTCPGSKKAVDEFFADKPEYPVYLQTGQCFIVKQ